MPFTALFLALTASLKKLYVNDGFQEIIPAVIVTAVYGMSEIGGFALQDGTQSGTSLGRPTGSFDCRVSIMRL